MNDNSPKSEKIVNDIAVLAILCGLIFTVYLFTASLTFISNDELFLFDTTESFTVRQSPWLNITSDIRWPGHTNAEPIQPLFSVPLYWLAFQFQEIGNAHTTLFFNIIVTVTWSAVLYLHLRALAITQKAAAATVLIFAFTTIVWPYTKNYFREPLAGLMLSISAYMLLRLKQADTFLSRQFVWRLAAVVVFTVIGILTKEAVIIGLPIIALQFLDSRIIKQNKKSLRVILLIGGLVIVILFGVLFIYQNLLNSATDRFQFLARFALAYENRAVALPAITGFIFSPGKSLFIYSPAILIGVAALFIRKNNKLIHLWPLILIPVFVIIYGFIRGEVWFGGLNWGPRYMVPITGLLMIPVGYAIQHQLEKKSKRWQIFIWAICGLGFLVQIGAVSVNPLQYYQLLDRTEIEGAAWVLGIWNPQYSAAFTNFTLLSLDNLDFAWHAAPVDGPLWYTGILLSTVSIFFLLALIITLRKKTPASSSNIIWGLISVVTVLSLSTHLLKAIYADVRYSGHRLDLQSMRIDLEQKAGNNSLIALDGRQYMWFMMNYLKSKSTLYTIADNPNDSLSTLLDYHKGAINYLDGDNIPGTIGYFAERDNQTKIFALTNHSQFETDTVVSMEWWLNEMYHLMSTTEYANDIRLTEYSGTQFSTETAAHAYEPAILRAIQPVYKSDFIFQDAIQLVGHDSTPPSGLISPGTILNISTVWQPIQDIDEALVIAIFLVNPQSQIELQLDAQPMNGFWPTTHWKADDIIRHNVALELPPDIAPGHYEVWTVMYRPDTGERLPVANQEGTSIRDHVVLFSVEVTR